MYVYMDLTFSKKKKKTEDEEEEEEDSQNWPWPNVERFSFAYSRRTMKDADVLDTRIFRRFSSASYEVEREKYIYSAKFAAYVDVYLSMKTQTTDNEILLSNEECFF